MVEYGATAHPILKNRSAMTTSLGKGRIASLVLGLLAALFQSHPADAQYHICWGDMHGHTALSDGKGIWLVIVTPLTPLFPVTMACLSPLPSRIEGSGVPKLHPWTWSLPPSASTRALPGFFGRPLLK